MNAPIYGKKTIAKDGFEYRSMFEAEFVNKFLIAHDIKYEREKLYSDTTKHRCDFYLPDYDVWIECVYEPCVLAETYKFGLHDIELSIPVANLPAQRNALSIGGKISKKTITHQKWIIPKSRIPQKGIPYLERYMDAALLECTYNSYKANMTENYNHDLSTKLLMYTDRYTIIQVNYADLENKPAHISDLIRIKNNELFLRLQNEKPNLISNEIQTTLLRTSSPRWNQNGAPPPKENKAKVRKSESEDIIFLSDGTPLYSLKKLNELQKSTGWQPNKKIVDKSKRLHMFTSVLNTCTTIELEFYVTVLTEKLNARAKK
jgi:hypothetical protein